MRELDRQYLETPFYRSRRMTACLEQRGILVSRNRVQRLMRVMGLQAIYRRPRTANRRWECGSIPTCWGRPKSPASTRRGPPTSLNLPMERGFVYLVVVMDCHSRYVLSWRLSNTLEGGFAPSL